MLAAYLAMIVAALFAGAAIYVNVAEQPARLALPDGPMLAQWHASYPRAASMQASLAIVGGVLAILAYVLLSDWRWVLAAILILANWPYTLVCIKPTNDALKSMQVAAPSALRPACSVPHLSTSRRASAPAVATCMPLRASLVGLMQTSV